MSHEQRQLMRGTQEETTPMKEAPGLTYGDVFGVGGKLATQPITPEDAAMMQAAESRALGQTQKDGAASAMQSAADINQQVGAIPSDKDTQPSSKVADEGVTVVETEIPGQTVTTEYVGGQAVRRISRPTPSDYDVVSAAYITIGEALEAAAVRVGDKPVEHSDAAAVQAAERHATGQPEIKPHSVAAAVQSAADVNARLPYEERTTLRKVLSRATDELPADKGVTVEDAKGVKEAEARHSSTGRPSPGVVADAMEAAARINERGGVTTQP